MRACDPCLCLIGIVIEIPARSDRVLVHVVVRNAACMTEQIGIVGVVGVAEDRHLRFCFGGDDRIDRGTDGRGFKAVARDDERTSLGRTVDAPQEDMVSHRLRPDLGAARQNLTVDREAAACVDAEIVGEFRVDHHFVAVFKRCHAVGVECIAAADEIYRAAREFMISAGNPTQWSGAYPEGYDVERGIRNGTSYVAEEDGEIVATFYFKPGNDPTYDVIYDGEWKNSDEYGVIHRIAVKYHGRAIAARCYEECFAVCKNLKIDTHRDNIPMQRSLEKCGFEYCGIIHLANGDERLAYQKIK